MEARLENYLVLNGHFLDVHLYYFEKKTISLFMKNNGFILLQVIKHKQILKLGYIMERVINVFPKLKFLEQ